MSLSFVLLFLRMYFFITIGKEMALVIGILFTFVSTTEGEIKFNLTDPGSIVQIATIFKILKVCLAIMVLSYNGTVNDYFVGIFFFYSGLIGMFFFEDAGLYIV